MEARSTMTRSVVVIGPELPLDAAWDILEERRIRHLPVVQAGRLVGLLSDRDVLLRATRGPKGEINVPAIPVGVAMSMNPFTCSPTTDVHQLVRAMVENKIDAIPVLTDTGELAGLVTSTDLLLMLLDVDAPKPLPYVYLIEQTEIVGGIDSGS